MCKCISKKLCFIFSNNKVVDNAFGEGVLRVDSARRGCHYLITRPPAQGPLKGAAACFEMQFVCTFIFHLKKLKKNLLRRVFFLIFNLPDFQFVSFPVCLCFNFSTFLWFPYFSVCPILQRLNKLLFYSYFCPSLFFLFCYFVWFILLCFPSPLWRLGFFWVHSVEQAKAVKLVKMVPHKELLYYIKLDIRNVIGGFSRYLMLVHWKGQKSNKSWNGVNPEWKQIQHLATSIKSQTKCIGKFICVLINLTVIRSGWMSFDKR